MWSIGDMMTDRELMQQSLEVLVANRRTHYYCEDTWYSCPRHEEGCANDAEGYECNCGADKANEQIDNTITALRERLAQPEQEPVCDKDPQGCWSVRCQLGKVCKHAALKEIKDDIKETFKVK